MPENRNLTRLYRGLEHLYGTDSGVDPPAFLTVAPPAGRRETLYFRQDDEGLEVALGLDPELVARFDRVPAGRALRALPFGQTLPIIEGLSHLLYVAEAVRCERPFSGLELEVQAEVDKLAVHLLDRWPPSPEQFDALVVRLFDAFEYVEGLSGDLRLRYETANRMARGFARHLAADVRERRLDRLRRALRNFWHAPLEDKRRMAA